LRVHHIVRPNESFHTSPLLPPIHLTNRYNSHFRLSDFLSFVGNPIAITFPMVLLTLRMKVLLEKRMELSQTIALLTVSIRTEKGCQRCDFIQSAENDNDLCLLEEWDNQEDLMSHLKSDRFRVLRGAMNLLDKPCELMFHTTLQPTGMEEI
jgi:quinol monooxygenase YgiN